MPLSSACSRSHDGLGAQSRGIPNTEIQSSNTLSSILPPAVQHQKLLSSILHPAVQHHLISDHSSQEESRPCLSTFGVTRFPRQSKDLSSPPFLTWGTN